MYHGDPGSRDANGALVFTIFGREMLVKLADIGFRTTLVLLYQPRCGMLGHDAVFFAAINGGDAHV